jgi:hypothetical protein
LFSVVRRKTKSQKSNSKLTEGQEIMKKNIITVFNLMILLSVAPAGADLQGRNLVEIESKVAKVVIDLGGGAIVDFHLTENDVNPLSWNHPVNADGKPRAMGHFICFDRWGPASAAETKKGMPWHGEATSVYWQLVSKPTTKDNKVFAEVACELPMAGLNLKRRIELDMNSPVLTVTEEITNVNKLGRMYNLVQHATIGPPFLDESTLVDTRVKKGLTQQGKMPLPEEPVIYWPKAVYQGRLIDFRRLSDDAGPGVVSFVFDDKDKYGWVTACNPEKELLLGYFWQTNQYPWLNMWRQVQDGRPSAYGFEFGTTGLHQPFKILVEKGKIFDRQLYEYIDADETITKTYTGFLARIPKDYKGVADIDFGETSITLKEQGGDNSRNIVVKIK